MDQQTHAHTHTLLKRIIATLGKMIRVPCGRKEWLVSNKKHISESGISAGNALCFFFVCFTLRLSAVLKFREQLMSFHHFLVATINWLIDIDSHVQCSAGSERTIVELVYIHIKMLICSLQTVRSGHNNEFAAYYVVVCFTHDMGKSIWLALDTMVTGNKFCDR